MYDLGCHILNTVALHSFNNVRLISCLSPVHLASVKTVMTCRSALLPPSPYGCHLGARTPAE